MPDIPRISDTEWEVMKIIWSHGPLTATQILERLIAQDRTWHPKTAGTLIGRLVRKGALGHAKVNRVYVYRALVTEKESLSAMSRSFLERFFGGALAPMLAHFVEEKKLSRRQMKELRKLLDDAQ